MTDAPTWPEELRIFLLGRFGEPRHVERLYGQSDHHVWLVRFGEGERIVKESGSLSEAAFYRDVVPSWPEIRPATPALDASFTLEGRSWLVLEFVPAPLPRERWLADPEILAVLRRVHEGAPGVEPATIFRPGWPAEMTEAFLRWLPEADRGALDRLRARCQPLFEPATWISGDPNPSNWGLRASGAVVLFDWERFGRGTPALDLAITVPGLGTREDFERVTRAYGGRARVTPEDLACAKAWALIEFVSEASASERRRATLERMRPVAADWLRAIRV